MIQTSTQKAVALPAADIPITKSADDLYNAIMVQIEPELVTTSLPMLKEKYKYETPEQKTQRGMRYKKAFDQYQIELERFQLTLNDSVQVYRKNALEEAEAKDKEHDMSELESIESSINAA